MQSLTRLALDNQVFSNNSRISVSRTQSQDYQTGTLQISDVHELDQGSYM